jgi:hypothetical protein
MLKDEFKKQKLIRKEEKKLELTCPTRDSGHKIEIIS